MNKRFKKGFLSWIRTKCLNVNVSHTLVCFVVKLIVNLDMESETISRLPYPSSQLHMCSTTILNSIRQWFDHRQLAIIIYSVTIFTLPRMVYEK